MTEPGDVIDLIHALGYLYLRHGQPHRAVVLLIIGAQAAPERADLLRTLAAALIEAEMGAQADDVLTRLCSLDAAIAAHPMLRLMRARALWLTGRAEQARALFQGREAA